MTTEEQSSALDKAPEHVKLAVDLIYLLESNDISAQIALDAIELVKADLLEKVKAEDK